MVSRQSVFLSNRMDFPRRKGREFVSLEYMNTSRSQRQFCKCAKRGMLITVAALCRVSKTRELRKSTYVNIQLDHKFPLRRASLLASKLAVEFEAETQHTINILIVSSPSVHN